MKRSSLILRLSILAATGAGLSALTALGSCTDGGPPVLGNGVTDPNGKTDCSTSNTGCACDSEGVTTSCGEVIRKAGDYVTCSEGKRSCQGGKWGACVGDSVYVKGSSISLGTLGLQSQPTQCQNNPCDPACTSYQDDGDGVDASGLTANDAGGLVLLPVESGPACTGIQCQVVTCDGGLTTTVTGTVRDPAGTNPIYNANVYVPNSVPAAFTPGVSADQCGSGGQLSGNPIVLTQTAADGSFTLTGVPVGNNIPLVIQIGRWRRQITIPTVTACGTTALSTAQTRLPKNQAEGDIPKIAIASGGCDPLECLLTRIGIDTAEFTVPSSSGRVSFYQGNGGMPLASGGTPYYDTLLTSQSEIDKFDLVFLPCQCGGEYGSPPIGSHDIIRNYTGVGGRLFTSHWGREWIEHGVNPIFPGVANWDGAFYGGSDPVDVYVDTSHPKGVAFASWLTAAGSSSPFLQTPSRYDVSSVIAPTVSMAYAWSDNNPGAHPGAPDNVTDMTFNTPLGVPVNQQVGRVVFADTHVSGSALQGWPVTNEFPTKCTTGALNTQEKALEFLIFDLSACVGPPIVPPPPPYPNPATFTRDYEGVCPAGKGPVWHFFDWMTHTPGNSNIVLSAQTADTQGTLPAAPTVGLATVSGAPILTWQGADVQTALDTLPSKSKAWLRVTITLNPTTDATQTPVLDAWRQAYDCMDNQ
ncbi:hypothetical protein BH09MYX1_BH09MYX1_12460 [soil metagenome]